MIHFFRFILLLLGDINVNQGPTNITNNSIPSNILPFQNCPKPGIPSECTSSGYYKAHDNSKLKIFKKKGFHVLYLNINSLLPKIDEIRLTAKKSNASIIEIGESKLD